MCESCGACVPSSQCCAPSGTRVFPMTGYGVAVIDRQAEERATFNVRTVAADGSILADLYAGTSREDRDRAIYRAMVAMDAAGTRIARVDVLTVAGAHDGAVVHRHAPSGPCQTYCGRPCDVGRVAYAQDEDTVTCPGCLEQMRGRAKQTR